MRRAFVDGGLRRGRLSWAAVLHDETGLSAVVETATADACSTTCSAEIEALRLGVRLLLAADGRRQLWSDSEYALRIVQPRLGTWRARKDRARVAAAVAEVRAAEPLETVHVRSHLKRRYDLPNFFPHELADRLAGDAVPGSFRISEGPVHAQCLTCRLFPCREPSEDALRIGAVGAYPEPCADFVRWPDFVATPIVADRGARWRPPT